MFHEGLSSLTESNCDRGLFLVLIGKSGRREEMFESGNSLESEGFLTLVSFVSILGFQSFGYVAMKSSFFRITTAKSQT